MDTDDDACGGMDMGSTLDVAPDITETIEDVAPNANIQSDASPYPLVVRVSPRVTPFLPISAPHPRFLGSLLDAGNAVLHLPSACLVHLRDRAAVQASVDAGDGRFLFPGWLLPFMPGVRKLPELPVDHDEHTPEGMRRVKRVNGAQRCEERRRWHMRAAFSGIMPYASERSARYMVMCRQRTDDMARFGAGMGMSMSEADNNPLAFILDSEERDRRRHQAVMGWASRFRSEHRIGRAWSRALNARAGYTSYGSWQGMLPLRLTPDAIDVQASEMQVLSLAA